MKPPSTEQALFSEAFELNTPAARKEFLDKACRGDGGLRARVESLLLAAVEAGDFLEVPPVGVSGGEAPNFVVSEKAGDRIGRYKLLEKIGEGGCGVVYMAEQQEPVRRRVALKIIKLGMDTRSVIARFEAERQALAMMEHPNIAKVLDGGATDAGRPFFVMELVRGVRITEFCNKTGLSTVGRLRLFIQVCQAIQHAHQKGIIHRDLKPSNILVTVNDNLAVPKVIDFGIAKATGERLTEKTLFTQFHSFIGTPAYTSPEQAEMSSVDIDTRSDIYSLGVLLYELLAGRTPFDGEQLLKSGLDEMRRVICNDEPPRPSTRLNSLRAEEISELTEGVKEGGGLREVVLEKRRLIQRVQGDLDWIVMKCLEKDRARRYETAAGLAADVQRHLSHVPIQARPVSALGRLQRWRLRHPTIAVLTASVLLLLVVVAAGSTVAAWRIMAANSRLAETVGLLKLQGAEEQFRSHESAAGVEHLATILHSDPNNEIAASRLVSALLHRNWALPGSPPMRHTDRVTTSRFSRDGQHVLSASWDKTAKIWDVGTGMSIATLQHEDKVLSGNYSADGRRVVTASADGTARIWNATNGHPMISLDHPNRQVAWAEFSPDGEQVLTICLGDQTVRIWNAETGTLVRELDHGSAVIRARFSPDNTRVATGTESGSVLIWQTGFDPAGMQTEGHQARVNSLQFGSDGRTLLSADDQMVRLWNSETGEGIGARLEPETVLHAALSSDGRTVLTASVNNRARLWDIQNGQLLHQLSHEGDVIFGAFSPDGTIALTTSMDNSTRLWDVRTGMPLCQPLREQEAIFEGAFSPDGQKVVTASWAGVAQVWNVEPRRSLGLTVQHGKRVMTVAFAPDGKSVVSASVDGTVRLLNAITGVDKCPPMRHRTPVHTAEFSRDGHRLVTASDDDSAYVWDTSTGALIAGPLKHAKKIWYAEFSPNGERIVTASRDGTAQIWDSKTGKPLLPAMQHGAQVNTARFSPDGRWIVTASENRSARVWDALTAKPVTEPLMHRDHVEWAEFSPDSQRIVSASSDNRAQIWEVRTGKPIGSALTHARTVTKAVFSPDGRHVATASLDCTARIWDAATGLPSIDPLIHEHPLVQVYFSADGRRLLTSCPASRSRLWDGRTGGPLTEWIDAGRYGCMSRFDKTGERIVSGSVEGLIRIWDSPKVPTPVPLWFIRFAEAVAGRRQSAARSAELVPREELQELARELNRSSGQDFYEGLGRWFLADPADRTINPFEKRSNPL